MRLIISLLTATIFVLCITVIAVHDSVVTGPYKVSFDMGLNRSDYNIAISAPKPTEALDGTEGTDYAVIINNINQTKLNEWGINKTAVSQSPISDQTNATSAGIPLAEIHIKESKTNQTVLSDDEIMKSLKKNNENDLRVSAITVSTLTIDGADGAIASMQWSSDPDLYTPVDLHDSIYFANFDPGHVMVEIVSFYPWDNGTLQLLKTIHVERAKI